jgi:hypothetical protein
VDDVNNLRWLRDRWRAAARSSCYHTVVIYLNIPHTELETRRRANQVTAEGKDAQRPVCVKRPATRIDAARMLKRRLKDAGLSDAFSPHSFNFGHALLATTEFEVLQFVFYFYGFET